MRLQKDRFQNQYQANCPARLQIKCDALLCAFLPKLSRRAPRILARLAQSPAARPIKLCGQLRAAPYHGAMYRDAATYDRRAFQAWPDRPDLQRVSRAVQLYPRRRGRYLGLLSQFSPRYFAFRGLGPILRERAESKGYFPPPSSFQG